VPRGITASASMIDRIGQAIAIADGGDFEADQVRYRGLAAAALEPLLHPTGAMTMMAMEADRRRLCQPAECFTGFPAAILT
jgi:hypothetical protein